VIVRQQKRMLAARRLEQARGKTELRERWLQFGFEIAAQYLAPTGFWLSVGYATRRPSSARKSPD
jgi:hypothetical protein